MGSDELSAKERAVLFALLAEARELPNPELEERAGFRLDGKERRKLNELKLVTSTKPARAFVHELSDAGWRWCANELSAGPGASAGNMERALYAVLAGLGRYLHSTDQSLSDIFNLRNAERPHERDGRAPRDNAGAESRILAGYQSLTTEPGEFIKLSELRRQIPDVPTADANAALDSMYQAQRINLVPESNQRALTPADREAALRIGGEDKHLISVRPR